eukprot:gene2717-1702_t
MATLNTIITPLYPNNPKRLYVHINLISTNYKLIQLLCIHNHYPIITQTTHHQTTPQPATKIHIEKFQTLKVNIVNHCITSFSYNKSKYSILPKPQFKLACPPFLTKTLTLTNYYKRYLIQQTNKT